MQGVYRGEGRYIRQGGGPGQYGHCIIELEAQERGTGVALGSRLVGGTLPKEFLPDIERGLRDALARGILAGFPIVDVRVTVVGGSFHEIDSTPFAFQRAGSLALQDACRQAPMTVLEPVAQLEVLTPPDFVGAVIGDLHRRRGRLEGQGTLADGTPIITSRLPVAETFGYATHLRSLTQGRASFSLHPSGYDEAPESVQNVLIARAA